METIQLSWDTYLDHMKEMLHGMMTSNTLTDATLICDDHKQFQVHKVILSACSPVFRSIISDHNSLNPIIYLRGIGSNEMKAILQFIYTGQATFQRDGLPEFLSVAKSLKIKEICDEVKDDDNEKNTEQHEEVKNDNTESNNKIEIQKDVESMASSGKRETLEKSNEIEKRGNNPQQEENLFDDMERYIVKDYGSVEMKEMNYGQEKTKRTKKLSRKNCNQCEKSYRGKQELKRHIKSAHDGVVYPCDQCEYEAKLKFHLKIHIQSVHDGARYPCNQCGITFSHQSGLNTHQKSVHEGILYPCDVCSFWGPSNAVVLKHKKFVHAGAKIKCKHCDKTFSAPASMYRHMKVHNGDGLKFPCDSCNYKATQSSSLIRHKRLIHEESIM